ncbi:fungal-specific transcription factor domain-containing protein [Microdochium trichocladiopsis]|uniref:Fungal-specific transcription factor domain-containing protein n=1 Tax=Microdochium trichocladiopsis TaxID=1682393 RepID=A0A9P8Y4F4_9PEZI|nr:fungal-specific transcription factor domain-containing protein [Microdochium trichocladiopsis]KAH7029491.1 fungal-specific transcription factor domain-containing protein [Microdochium trichocladiopsis]
MSSRKPPLAAALAARACVNCQKRKSRCARSNIAGEPCAYCSRAGKACSFQEPPRRTALTRDNLTAAQLECSRLRRLVRALQPDLDIDAALLDHSSTPETSSIANTASINVQSSSREPAYWVEERHGFEWHEGPDSPAIDEDGSSPALREDGMALFPTANSGYLGSSSGSDLIKDIAPFLPTPFPTSTQGFSHSLPSPKADESLSSHAMQSRLVDAYFVYYNTSFPILHEKTFREQLASQHRPPSTSIWRVVHRMVLAIGHWISTTNRSGDLSPYYAAARSRLSVQALESGTMATVQAFLLMGNYLQKNDRPNTAYNLIGIAHRMALGLGLHREPLHPSNDLLQERRRQLFWITFCFDCGFNITTGRPSSLYEGVVDCRLPQNIDDREVNLNSSAPDAVQVPTTYSALIAQSELVRLSATIYTEFLQAKTANTKIEYQVAEAMDQQLKHWRNALPTYFTSPNVPTWFLGPRAIVLWKEQNLRILLWRGSKPRHGFLAHKITAESRCRDAAMQTIHDIASFCTSNPGIMHLGITWYATYFLFQAALILEVGLPRENPNDTFHQDMPDLSGADDKGALEISVAAARNCLAMLGPSNISAKRCQDLLERVHELSTQMRNSQVQGIQQLPSQANVVPSTTSERAPGSGEDFPSASPPGIFSYPDFGANDEFHLAFGDFAADHTLRMLIDQTYADILGAGHLNDIFQDGVTSQNASR